MKDKLQQEISNKRFDDYTAATSEVFKIQGLDYQTLEDSIFDYVSQKIKDYKNKSILDIGIGDGASIKNFVEAGCTSLTGLDINSSMLEKARERFGRQVRLVEGNAVNMDMFKVGDFPIIISGACVHNIPRTDRVAFWAEIIRLKPEAFIMIEKVMDNDQATYAVRLKSQMKAFDQVFREKYNKPESAKEWIEHLKSDEPEKIELSEIVNNLGVKYDVKIIFEMGIFKTVACRLKP